MKLETARDALLTQLQTVTRVASTRSAVQALSGRPDPGHGRRRRAARHRHGGRACACPLDAEVGPRGHGRAPGAPAARRRARAARRARHARAPAERAGRRDRLAAPRRSTFARCAPTTSHRFPEAGGDAVVSVPRRRVRRHGRHASRAPPRATRRARSSPASSSRRRATSCGWSPPTPTACGEGDAARGAARRAPSRPTCRRARCRSSAGSSPSTRAPSELRDRRARQPGRLRGRRRHAVLAADRRPVPQLPPAAARQLRARAALPTRRARRTSCAASACWRRRTRRCG